MEAERKAKLAKVEKEASADPKTETEEDDGGRCHSLVSINQLR